MKTTWTEAQAKAMVCHLTVGTVQGPRQCGATTCMAWRWARPGKIMEKRTFATEAEFDAFLESAPEGWEERWPDSERMQDRREQWVRRAPPIHGYCGRLEGNA